MEKKGYNWRARQVVNTVIDDSKTKKITVVPDDKTEHYDECNALVLPSEKRKTKVKHAKQQVTRILSKKQRKSLEKIVDRKKKKENRASLLDALSKVQVTSEELNQLTSISSVQTKGLKKHFREQKGEVKPKRKHEESDESVKINSLSGSKRKKLSLFNGNELISTDQNIVGVDQSDSEESENSECEHDETNVNKDEVNCNETDENSLNRGDSCTELKLEEKGNKQEIKPPNKHANKAEYDSKEKNKQTIDRKTVERKPTVFIPVDRDPDIQKNRLKLPILSEEQEIMETINENPVIILAGETGSGKTTQVPQFLYEAGYATEKMIGVTEPRRVAAIAMSKRVAEEMNLSKEKVSYLIRFEGNVTDNTKIKFMTDGVLLKELQSDFLLTKYSVIILDEAHERSVYTDILVGLLSRIVPLRNKKGNPLKLIIMSATLRLEDFTENSRLFKMTPPVITVDSRQFPVTIHFNKRTAVDYVKEAFNKAVKIHTRLPEGGILIFLTGQLEVNTLVRRLRKAFPLKHKSKILEKPKSGASRELSDDSDVEDNMKRALKKKTKTPTLPEINLEDYAMPGEEDGNGENEDVDSNSDEEVIETITNSQPLWTLPLYSLLPSYKQAKIFDPPPEGCRLCIVATNVAETSLTIPNIKYVIDTGKAKMKLYDKVTGVSSYQVAWTSKAAANQRAGRAGRVGPGYCYRLYSSAVYNDVFHDFSVPEIKQKPVDDLYLQMKCMNIDKIVNFPFPSAPNLLQLKSAENKLEILGALKEGKVTPLGKAISQFPVLPRFGKMLALSQQQDLLAFTVCLVAALSVQEVLLETPIVANNSEESKALNAKWTITRRQWAGHGNLLLLGDPMVLLKAVGAAEYANSEGKLDKFCMENGLRYKAVLEIRKLRLQLTNEIKINVPGSDIIVDPKMAPPNEVQVRLLRQIMLSGMGDQVAKRIEQDEIKEDEDKKKFKYAYRSLNMEDPVFMHSSSVLRKSLPEFVVYQEIYETNKMYMRCVTAIEPEWLPIYVPQLCNLSEPLLSPEPRYESSDGKIYCSVNGTFGKQGWTLPTVEIEFPKTLDLYKWFARFLLEGSIFKNLARYRDNLLSTPSSMVKSWAKLQTRTDALLKVLIAGDISSKKKLEDIWKTQPQFLLHEYQKWLPESAHNDVSLMWPPLD